MQEKQTVMRSKLYASQGVVYCIISMFILTSIPLIQANNPYIAVRCTGWGQDLRVTTDSHDSHTPSLAIDSAGNSHIVWADNRDGSYEIYYEKKSSTGQTLINDQRLTTHTTNADYVKPKILLDSDLNLHILWYTDFNTGNSDLHYLQLNNQGQVITPETSLDASTIRYRDFDAALTEEYVGAIEPTLTKDGSTKTTMNTKQDIQEIDPTLPREEEIWMTVIHIVFIGNNQDMILVQPLPTEVWYMKIRDTGAVLIPPRAITADSPWSYATYMYPNIAIDHNGYLQIVTGWFQGDPDSPTFAGSFLNYMKLDNQGNILVSDTRFTPNFSGQNWFAGVVFPESTITVDSQNHLIIIWEDKRNQLSGELYFTTLDNNGNTIIDDTTLTTINQASWGNHMHPDITIDALDRVHVIWSDARSTIGNDELYYRCFTTTGQSISPLIRLTYSTGSSIRPSIASDTTNNARITWEDSRDGNPEIYLKKQNMLLHEQNDGLIYKEETLKPNTIQDT
jgi:hypothetical protein